MAQYCEINILEFERFLNEYSQGNASLNYVGSERVYTWPVAENLYIKVFSSLHAGAAEVGEDAIRVVLMALSGDKLIPLGKQKRVHRVVGWKSNLMKRLDAWKALVTPPCRLCKGYTVQRTNRQDTFYGCIRYPECKGSGRHS